MAPVHSQPGCLHTINELQEGEDEGQRGRKVLWRRGESASTLSMTLKSALSYMLWLCFLCLPCPPHAALHPSVSASRMMMCLVGLHRSCVCVCGHISVYYCLSLPLAKAPENMKSCWADSMNK